MSQDLEEQVIRRVAEAAGVEPPTVSLESSFAELNIDSLSAVSLIGDMEDEFGVSIPNEEVINIRTVGNAIDSLVRALAAAGRT